MSIRIADAALLVLVICPWSSACANVLPQREQQRQASPEQQGSFPGSVRAGVALGSFTHDVALAVQLPGEDDSVAELFQLGVEGGDTFGAGLNAEFTIANDELRVFGPSTAGFEDTVVDVYPHFMVDLRGDRVRVPIRIGPLVHLVDEELTASIGTVSLEMQSIGGRIGIEPAVDVLSSDDLTMTLYSGVGASFAKTAIDVDTTVPGLGFVSGNFSTDMRGIALDVGARIAAGRFFGSLGYAYRNYDFDQSDPEGGLVVEAQEFTFHGVLVTLGLTW